MFYDLNRHFCLGDALLNELGFVLDKLLWRQNVLSVGEESNARLLIIGFLLN